MRCRECKFYDVGVDQWPCDNCVKHSQFESKVRCLDPTEYTPDWEAQAKAIKQLEVRANDASDSYSYIREYLGNNLSWGIAESIFPEARFKKGQYVFCDVYGSWYYGIITEIRRYENPIDARYRFIYDVEVPAKGTFTVEEERLMLNNNVTKEDNNMKKKQNQRKRNRNVIQCNGNYSRDINEIIFNGPATIIKWSPSVNQYAYGKKGDKTVAVCDGYDCYSKTTGFLLAIIKEFFDNQSYDNILRKIDSFYEEEVEELTVSDIVDMLLKRKDTNCITN